MENNQIQKHEPQHNIAVWQKLDDIRKIFAPELNESEFQAFVSIGKHVGADPFKREIWAVKYNGKTSIFCGRDFYRKEAQNLADYDGHIVDAVYSNDKYSNVNGVIRHEITSLSDRGTLLGAYCTVYKKSIKYPYSCFALLSEYNKGYSNWKTMPETMIKKVVEGQALRGAFQGKFAGTYDESENWIDATVVNEKQPENKVTIIEPEKIEPKKTEPKKKKEKPVITLESEKFSDAVNWLLENNKNTSELKKFYDFSEEVEVALTAAAVDIASKQM